MLVWNSIPADPTARFAALPKDEPEEAGGVEGATDFADMSSSSRGKTLEKVRRLIKEARSEVVEEWNIEADATTLPRTSMAALCRHGERAPGGINAKFLD